MNKKEFLNLLESNEYFNLVFFVKKVFDYYNIKYTISNNSLKASSPFRSEDSTASFNVSGSKNIWKDFGSSQFVGHKKFKFLKTFLEVKENKQIDDADVIKKICEIFPEYFNIDEIDTKPSFQDQNIQNIKTIFKTILENNTQATFTKLQEQYSLAFLRSIGLSQEMLNKPLFAWYNQDDEVIDLTCQDGSKYIDVQTPSWFIEGNQYHKIYNLQNCTNGKPLAVCFNFEDALNHKNRVYLPLKFISKEQIEDLGKISKEVNVWLPEPQYKDKITKIQNKVITPLLEHNFKVNDEFERPINKMFNGKGKIEDESKLIIDKDYPDLKVKKFNGVKDQEIKNLYNTINQLAKQTIFKNPDALNYLYQRGYDDNYIKINNLGFLDIQCYQKLLGFHWTNDQLVKTTPLTDITTLINSKLITPNPIIFDVEWFDDNNQKRVSQKSDLAFYTLKQKIDNHEINLNEVIILKNENTNRYVVFKPKMLNRVTIPILDENKDVVTFIGRSHINDKLLTLEQKQNFRKYLFVANIDSQDPFNAKHNLLFNIDKIQPNSDFVILTEGQLDAASVNYFTNLPAVGLGGLSISEHQMALLKQKTNTIYLGFDNDDNQAGFNGTIEVGKKLLKYGFKVFVLDITNSQLKVKDYDELFTKLKNDSLKTMGVILANKTNFEKIICENEIKAIVDDYGLSYTAYILSFEKLKNEITDFKNFVDVWNDLGVSTDTKICAKLLKTKAENKTNENKTISKTEMLSMFKNLKI